MKAAVAAGLVALFSKWEGALPFMYLDVKCLVTTGVGDLVDPVGLALGLPWVNPDGTAANHATINAEWMAVKARRDLAPCGGGHFASVTKIRLTKDGVLEVIRRTMATDEAYFLRRWPAFASWPADAQMATFSWAWAVGAASPYPKFSSALVALDFDAAAEECWIGPRYLDAHGVPMADPKNPGVHPRNLANVQLFKNAARVLETGADPERIYYPGTVPQRESAEAGVDEDDTDPPPVTS